MNTTLDPRAVASNALRNIALHLVTPSDRANDWVGCVIVRVHRMMRIDPNDSRTTMVNGSNSAWDPSACTRMSRAIRSISLAGSWPA